MAIFTNNICKVEVTDFAKKKYLKSFYKEKKNVFQRLWFAFDFMLRKPEQLLKKKDNEVIHDNGNVAICKCYFKSELKKSAKSSGGRVIIAWHREDKLVRVLLAYGKKHIRGGHETVWWEGVVKQNFVEYKELL